MNASVLTIHNHESNHVGTGFVIQTDDAGIYVATCGHVVRDCKKDILVLGKKAEILHNEYYNGVDLAVLYVEGLQKSALVLDSTIKPDKVKVIGCSKFMSDVKREQINSVEIKFNIQLPEKNIELFKLYPKESISKGYSGSPVICEETNKVVGVVNIEVGDNTNYGICINELTKIHNPKNKKTPKINKKKINTQIDPIDIKVISKKFKSNLNRALHV